MDKKALKMTYRPTAVAPVPQVLGTGLPKNIDESAAALKAKLGAGVVINTEKNPKGDPALVVEGSKIFDVLKFLRDDERFYCTLLQVISAVDYLPVAASSTPAPPPAEGQAPGAPTVVAAKPGYIVIFYSLYSYVHRHQINVKVHLDRDKAKIASVVDLYRAANWYERECYDMVGVQFENHPDLTRILLPQDWVGHPLRRDYVFPEEYNGMKVPL